MSETDAMIVHIQSLVQLGMTVSFTYIIHIYKPIL